jgi:Flp pilus assembly protein CpaB
VAIQASKPNNRVFLLLGIILAALAFGGVLFALRGQGGNTTNVVVAKQSIPAGTTLTSDLVTTVSEPASAVPSDHYAVATAVVGKTTTVTVGANDPIVPAFFAAQPLSAPVTTANGTTAPVSLSTAITKGFVALAIPSAGTGPGATGDLTSVGFYILPGDHIDILIDPGTPGNPGVRYSFQDVPVLRVGDSGTSGAPSVYIVEVPRSQAELLTALITNKGLQTVVKYVLRPQSEWGKVAPDNSNYTPNYEDNTAGPQVPPAKDNTVTVGILNRLFGS